MTHYGRQASTVHVGEAGRSASILYETHLAYNTEMILTGQAIILTDLHREQVNWLVFQSPYWMAMCIG